MTRRGQSLAAPRLSAPDLPPVLEEGAQPARGEDSFQLRWSALSPVTDAAHSAITAAALGIRVEG